MKATLAEMRARRKAAQPSGIKTFGSTFKNPEDPKADGKTAGQLLQAAGCRGLRIGGASFSAKHANFVENHGEATTADVIALMAEGRRRVQERFGIELEPEVQLLGEVEFPSDWKHSMIAAGLLDRLQRLAIAARRSDQTDRPASASVPDARSLAPRARTVVILIATGAVARRRLAVVA